MCFSEGEWARQNIEVPFERGIVGGALCTSLCQELQRCWVFHAQQLCVSRMATTQRTSSHLYTTVGSIGVNRLLEAHSTI